MFANLELMTKGTPTGDVVAPRRVLDGAARTQPVFRKLILGNKIVAKSSKHATARFEYRYRGVCVTCYVNKITALLLYARFCNQSYYHVLCAELVFGIFYGIHVRGLHAEQ